MLCMDCTLIAVFKEAKKVCFRSLLEGKNGRALHSQIRLQIGSNLFDKTLEGCLPDQKISVLLVFMDLTNCNGPRVVTMGFLHAPHMSSLLLCSLLQDDGVGPFPQLTGVRFALFWPFSTCQYFCVWCSCVHVLHLDVVLSAKKRTKHHIPFGTIRSWIQLCVGYGSSYAWQA
jgi:hypothetical protein